MFGNSRKSNKIVPTLADLLTASGILTSNNTNVSNGDTVTIGTQIYTFKTALTSGNANPGEVLIGASADASLTNLAAAINGTAGGGTTYDSSTPLNTNVTSGAVVSHTITVTAKVAGQAQNTVATTTTALTLSWGYANLDGGAGGVLTAYNIDVAQAWNTQAIDVQEYSELIAFLNTYSHAGTTPTLDVKMQFSYDYDPKTGIGDWVDSGDAFTQVTTTNGIAFKKMSANFGRWVRFVLTLGGTTPQYKIDLAVFAKV